MPFCRRNCYQTEYSGGNERNILVLKTNVIIIMNFVAILSQERDLKKIK